MKIGEEYGLYCMNCGVGNGETAQNWLVRRGYLFLFNGNNYISKVKKTWRGSLCSSCDLRSEIYSLFNEETGRRESDV